MSLANCRECNHPVSTQAAFCPHCGAPRPSLKEWTGYGFEYKTKTRLFGLPLVHVSFKYRNGRPVVAKGVIAIGQFAVGIVSIAQFGIGAIGIAQFGLGGLFLAQICAALASVAQISVNLVWGIGQIPITLLAIA